MLSKPLTPLSTPYPKPTQIAKPTMDPVAERMVANINRVVNAIRRNKLTRDSALQRIGEFEAELGALIAAAAQLGIKTETDEATGLRRLVTGDASRPDPTVSP